MKKSHICLEEIYTYEHLLETIPKCYINVHWKESVQGFERSVIEKMYEIENQIIEKRKLPYFAVREPIIIHERGKERTIRPIAIMNRTVQKLMCDYAIIPAFSPTLIYANGASQPGKGVDFTRKLIKKYMIEAKNKFGSDYYVMTLDYKSFFDSIPHSVCYKVLSEKFTDPEVVKICMEFIIAHHIEDAKKNYPKNSQELKDALAKIRHYECTGISLGSQVSQWMAIIVPSYVDHYIKDRLGVKYYIRYMDDMLLFAKTKEELLELKEIINRLSQEIGLRLNPKKVCINKAKNGFTFLKFKYHITDSGKIIMRLTRQGISRMRRKMKKLAVKYYAGEISLRNISDSLQSWMSHSYYGKAYTTRKNMMQLFEDLFHFKYSELKKRAREEEKLAHEQLQAVILQERY